jgi:hypothetical protein
MQVFLIDVVYNPIDNQKFKIKENNNKNKDSIRYNNKNLK